MEEFERILQTPTKNRRGSYLVSKNKINDSSDQQVKGSDQALLNTEKMKCKEQLETPQGKEEVNPKQIHSEPPMKFESFFEDDFAFMNVNSEQ